MFEPEKTRSEDGEDEKSLRAVMICEVKVGVSPVWKGAMSHSDSDVPEVGPPR